MSQLSKAELELLKEICLRCTGEGCTFEQIKHLLAVEDEKDPFLTRLINLKLVRKDSPNSSHSSPTYKATAKGWGIIPAS